MAQLRREQSRFEEAGLKVVLVGMGSPEEAEGFRQRFGVPFPVVCDRERRLYRAYGLERGGLGQLLSPSLLLRTLEALGDGHLPGPPQGDVYQLPGTYLIDPEGVIRFRHVSRDAADHPSPEALLEAARSLTP